MQLKAAWSLRWKTNSNFVGYLEFRWRLVLKICIVCLYSGQTMQHITHKFGSNLSQRIDVVKVAFLWQCKTQLLFNFESKRMFPTSKEAENCAKSCWNGVWFCIRRSNCTPPSVLLWSMACGFVLSSFYWKSAASRNWQCPHCHHVHVTWVLHFWSLPWQRENQC